MGPVSSKGRKNQRTGLWLSRKHWAQMANDVAARLPEEACGLVAGQDGRSIAVFPVVNQLHSPVRFRMEPHQQVRFYFKILEEGWELAAIYHSHPAGPQFPSLTDIAEHAYPEALSLIWYPRRGAWRCRGFQIQDGMVSKVRVHRFLK